LRKHQTVHTGAKPHQCDVCGRQFRERGTLREHHRIHTGAMPFTCEFCGKSFRFKGILTVSVYNFLVQNISLSICVKYCTRKDGLVCTHISYIPFLFVMCQYWTNFHEIL